MKVITNISSDFEELQIIINAKEMNQDLQNILNAINHYDSSVKTFVGIDKNQYYVIDSSEIICFYSLDKKNYFKTKNQLFEIKYRLYEIEEMTDDNFLRISNSTIVNLKHVKCFDTAEIGNIVVILDDDSKEYVSKRKISEIFKYLKERNGK